MPSLMLWALHASVFAQYSLVVDESTLLIRVFKDERTAFSGYSHDHVIVAKGWQGSAVLDLDAPSRCRAEVEVPVAKLDVDPPALRKKIGLAGELSEDDRGKIRASMLADDQLHGAKYPIIRFVADGCVRSARGIDMAGSLTIRGVTRTVEVPLSVTVEDERVRARGTLDIKSGDFGFEPYSAFLGAVKNREVMTLVFDLVGRESP